MRQAWGRTWSSIDTRPSINDIRKTIYYIAPFYADISVVSIFIGQVLLDMLMTVVAMYMLMRDSQHKPTDKFYATGDLVPFVAFSTALLKDV